MNDDGYISPLDVLMVINELNRRSNLPGEGEGVFSSAFLDNGSENSLVNPIDDELLSVLAFDATPTLQRPYQGKKRR